MIVTARVGYNADMLPLILQLYLPPNGSRLRVLDMTYGKGSFWNRERRIVMDINLVGIDALTPAHMTADFRALPFKSVSFDCVVFDPPYASLSKPNAKLGTSRLFGLGTKTNVLAPRSNKDIINLYAQGFREAARVLKPKGLFIIKCQDNDKFYNHITLMNPKALRGRFAILDLFVLVQHGHLPMRGVQHRARKNHSYFIVYRRA